MNGGSAIDLNIQQNAQPASFPIHAPATVNQAFELLKDPDFPGTWSSLGTALTGKTRITWWLGGTLPDESGSHHLVVLVLEEDNASFAVEVGSSILQYSIDYVYAK